MNSFVQAATRQVTSTTNGMKAMKDTGNALTTLFFEGGAMRGKDITTLFGNAYGHDRDLALRLALWLRDVRGGAGERQHFRSILQWLEKFHPEDAELLITKTPEVGRWDDLFVFQTKGLKEAAFVALGNALRERNGLAAKWTPRKGALAEEIRKFYGMTPKQYRKSLVALTNVVESKMCANLWEDIEFSHVPSVASSRYKGAFKKRQAQRYTDYLASVVKGEAKMNASAIFPHDVLKGLGQYGSSGNEDAMVAQWSQLPNYVGNNKVLPMIDVSGSMSSAAAQGVTAMHVALSLGLYMAEKNTGAFKDMYLTFHSNPELRVSKGNIVTKYKECMHAPWGGSTSIQKAFELVLKTAKNGNVKQEDMPDYVIVFSDMQFNQAGGFSAHELVKAQYAAAGYKMPQLVFWNLCGGKGNAPVTFDTNGTAMVSGFSPAVAEAVLAMDIETFTPWNVMLKAIMKDRYAV